MAYVQVNSRRKAIEIKELYRLLTNYGFKSERVLDVLARNYFIKVTSIYTIIRENQEDAGAFTQETASFFYKSVKAMKKINLDDL